MPSESRLDTRLPAASPAADLLAEVAQSARRLLRRPGLTVAAVALAWSALLACLLPARKALSIDPATTLRMP